MTVATANSGFSAAASSDIFQILLQDDNGQTILGIDDGTLRQTLQIVITNISGSIIESKNIAAYPVSRTNYHFRIRFRPGTLLLKNQINLLEANQGWKIYQEDHDFYFLFPSVLTINKGNSITLSLQNISAAPEGGSRGTRVEFFFNNLKYQGTNEDLTGTRLQYLNIVNQRGRQQIPLYVGFVGSNTILNDGTVNDLILSIQALPNASVNFQIVGQTQGSSTTTESAALSLLAAPSEDSDINIVVVKNPESIPNETNSGQPSTGTTYYLQGTQEAQGSLSLRGVSQNSQSQATLEEAINDAATKFTISLDTDNSAAWALTTPNDANGIAITIESNADRWSGGKIERVGMAPQWSFICQTGWSTTGREEILRLRITNLKTNLPPGYANLYVHYENIPGYWDGRITCPIHKGALVYRNDKVGIGTNTPNTKLEVAGGRLRVSKSDATNAGVIEIANSLRTNYVFTHGTSGHLYLRTDSPDHHLILQAEGSQGKVGIGTINPQAKLEVAGGSLRVSKSDATNAVIEIANASTTNYVFTDGTSGHLCLRTGSPDHHLILQAEGSQGKVGIGTINPQAKLEVPEGAIFNGVAVGVDPASDIINPPFPYETVSTTNPRWNLRLHSHLGIHFHAGNQGIPQMGIYADGNVEIITDLLLKRFPANDTTPSLTKLSLSNRRAEGTVQEWALYTAAVGGGYGVNPNGFEIWEYPATLSRFQIRAGGNTVLVPQGGNVGIGTISPSEKLHVNGNLLLDGELRTSTGQKPIIAQRFSQNVSTSDFSTSDFFDRGSYTVNTNYQSDTYFYFLLSSSVQIDGTPLWGALTVSNLNNFWQIVLRVDLLSLRHPDPFSPNSHTSINYTADLIFVHRTLIHRIGL